MTRWSVAAVVALLMGMPGSVSAGWGADCRAAARECKKSHGASLTVPGDCGSPNCGAGHCIMVNGETYVRLSDALDGTCLTPGVIPHGACPSQNCAADCLFLSGGPYVNMFAAIDGACNAIFTPPNCFLCSDCCATTTTTTATSTTTTQ